FQLKPSPGDRQRVQLRKPLQYLSILDNEFAITNYRGQQRTILVIKRAAVNLRF
ncbi:MAG: hypothetical protein RL068_730, partial [Actinomycetota bacterium]